MHCVNCGTQNLETTRYCKSCGANLEVLRQALTQNVTSGALTMIGPKHVGLILTLSALLGIGGLGIVFGGLVALSIALGPSLGGARMPLLLLLGGAGVFGVCFMVSSMMRMLKSAPAQPMPQIPVMQAALEPPPANHALPSFRDPVGSVVEHTTARLGQYAKPERETPER
jgi:hypothetical protein